MGRELYLFLIVFGLLSVVLAGDVQELKEDVTDNLRIVVLNASGGSDLISSCSMSIYDSNGIHIEDGSMVKTGGTNVRRYSFKPPIGNVGRWFANVSCNDGKLIGSQAFEFVVVENTIEERISNLNSTIHSSLALNSSNILSRIETVNTSINTRLGNPFNFRNETGSPFKSIMDVLRQIFFRQKRQLVSVSGTALNGTGGPIILGSVTSWLYNCTTTMSTCGGGPVGLPHGTIINNGAYSFQFNESMIPGYIYKVVSNVTGDDQSVNLTTFING